MEEQEPVPEGQESRPEPPEESLQEPQEAPQETSPETTDEPGQAAAVLPAELPPVAADSVEGEPPEESRLEPRETPEESGQPEAVVPDELPPVPAVSVEDLLAEAEPVTEIAPLFSVEDAQLKAVLEAIIYVADEPLMLAQLAAALQQPAERVRTLIGQLVAEFDKPEHGVTIREVAGGYKMATKPEHHEGVRSFVKSLKPPLKLSLPALETLAVIAYKQPVTAPEIMEIRGVQGAGVLKTLLDRKLIAAAGRKNVIGKPILYKTTKEFLVQFGLKDLSELPSLKEFEDIRRMAFADSEVGRDSAPEQASPASSAVEESTQTNADAGTAAGSEGESAAPPQAAEEN